MKINVLCATRENPYGLVLAIASLESLSSGRHDISYVVSTDVNDQTWAEDAAPLLGRMPVAKKSRVVVCCPRNICLGTSWNMAANLERADAYALVTDRCICITPNWDEYIADAFLRDDRRPVWWTTNAGPVIPIIPNRWFEVAGLYTDYFPFWFDDTWVHEVSALVFGLPNYSIPATCFIAKKNNPTTKRLRDLRFWMDFFIFKRDERRARAAAIRKEFGLQVPDMAPIEEWFRQSDAVWDSEWNKWEDAMGDKTSRYFDDEIRHKKNIEDIMNVKGV